MSFNDVWPDTHTWVPDELRSGLTYGQFMDNFLREPDRKEQTGLKPGRRYDWRRKNKKEI